MIVADIVVAGAGISGLLLASVLSARHSVVILEQSDALPNGKYWLTETRALEGNEELATSIERTYTTLDFVAYDGLRATVRGNYHLWDTQRLTSQLSKASTARGATLLTGCRFYSFEQSRGGIVLRANAHHT